MNAWQRALRGGRHDLGLHLSSVFSVGVAFICLATALLVVANVQELRVRWSHNGRASVYLQPNADPAAIDAIMAALKNTRGVLRVDHVTSEAARTELLRSGDEILAGLPPEAFPASLEVQVYDPERSGALGRMAEKLRLLPRVEAVETYEAWGERLGTLLGSALTGAGVLALVVLATVASVVGSTIRLSLTRRRLEVQVLKVVGATDDYVRRPFVIEGAAQGALGATVALTVVVVLFLGAYARFDTELVLLLGAPPSFLPWYASLGMVALGTFLGAISAHLSVRKLLAV
jgi:cell division transport system permease protein